jgi:hypothetical protein
MRRLNLPLAFVLILFFAVNLTAQTPQYYNYNNVGASSNTFPFGQTAGKAVQWLFLAGDFNQPAPLPPGNQITKVWYFITTGGTRTFTDLTILMAQDTIVTLTTGAFYSGTMDTVYHKASVTLTGPTNGWMSITLDTPYPYDPTKSLIVMTGQCASTGSGMYVRQNVLPNIRRVWSVGGCPFAPYAGGDGSTLNFGVDVEPSGPPQVTFASTWCPLNSYPSLPSATYFQAAAWLGDTLYVQTPSTTGAGQTTIQRYTLGGSWTTGVPCLVGVTGATLTAANGKLYLIGGGTTSVTTGTNNVQEYNPATGTWTAKAPLPAALSAHGAANWGDSVIFVVGGPYTGAATNLAVHYYRIASNTWGTISNSLPSGQGRRSHATAIVGNKLIIAAGYNTAFLKNMFIGTIGSDASQITWAAGPDVPTPWTGISRTAGAGYFPFFYLVAGERGGVGGYSDSTFVFNTVSNLWQQIIDNKPVAMSNMWAGVAVKVVNDTVKLFVPGGYSGVANAAFDVLGCGGTITKVKNVSTVPADYSLSQNYPNPFNPATKINFSIPKSGFVTLKVFDMLGREVANLISAEKQAGSYIVDFNASYLSSGVYFYKLEVNGFVDIKKMMLIK